MFYLISAKARFKTVKDFNFKEDIKEGKIKLLTSDDEILTIDFTEHNISIINQKNELYDIDEIDKSDKIKYVNIAWNEGLNYISFKDLELYQEDAQYYTFASMPEIKGISELSYNIDDNKYQNGELLEVMSFDLFFKDKSGNIKVIDLI